MRVIPIKWPPLIINCESLWKPLRLFIKTLLRGLLMGLYPPHHSHFHKTWSWEKSRWRISFDGDFLRNIRMSKIFILLHYDTDNIFWLCWKQPKNTKRNLGKYSFNLPLKILELSKGPKNTHIDPQRTL